MLELSDKAYEGLKRLYHTDMKALLKNESDIAEKHGKWIFERTYYEADECHCSECGQKMTTHTGERMNFCPRCGAKMDGGNKNE